MIYYNVNSSMAPPPDFYVRGLSEFHLFEWNLFNSPLFTGQVGYDFDGILCHDWPGNETGERWHEGEGYCQHLATAPPLYLPRRDPIPLLVTGRLEKHRAATEAWLERHRVQVDWLVMWPGSESERWEQTEGVANIVRYKAEHYAASDLKLFIESDAGQAEGIARLTGKPVVCPAAEKVF